MKQHHLYLKLAAFIAAWMAIVGGIVAWFNYAFPMVPR